MLSYRSTNTASLSRGTNPQPFFLKKKRNSSLLMSAMVWACDTIQGGDEFWPSSTQRYPLQAFSDVCFSEAVYSGWQLHVWLCCHASLSNLFQWFKFRCHREYTGGLQRKKRNASCPLFAEIFSASILHLTSYVSITMCSGCFHFSAFLCQAFENNFPM